MPSAAGTSLESDGSFWPPNSPETFFKRGFYLSILTTYIHHEYNNAYISVDRGVFRKRYMMTLCVWTRMMYPHCGPHTQTFYTHSSTHTQKETLVLKQRLSWWTVKSLSEMSRGNHPRFAECGWTKLFKLLSAVGRLDSSFLICSHSSSLSCSLARSLSQLKSLNFILKWRFAVVGIKHRNLFLIYLFV